VTLVSYQRHALEDFAVHLLLRRQSAQSIGGGFDFVAVQGVIY